MLPNAHVFSFERQMRMYSVLKDKFGNNSNNQVIQDQSDEDFSTVIDIKKKISGKISCIS